MSNPACQNHKSERVKAPGLLEPLPFRTRPSMGGYQYGFHNTNGKDVILVIVDKFTRYGHFITLSTGLATFFLNHLYKLHGLPSKKLSDRDPVFTSFFWKELFDKLQIRLNMSTAYHPQTDGQTERVNQCIEGYLRCMVSQQQRKWNKWHWLNGGTIPISIPLLVPHHSRPYMGMLHCIYLRHNTRGLGIGSWAGKQ